jgi:endo-alpha-1,4-polygalactosaminidase (GH114 family)
LKKDGYYVYTIEYDLNNEKINSPLSNAEKEHNSKLLAKTRSLDIIISNMKKSMCELKNMETHNSENKKI